MADLRGYVVPTPPPQRDPNRGVVVALWVLAAALAGLIGELAIVAVMLLERRI